MLVEVRQIYRQSRKPIDDFWTGWVSRPPAAFVVWLLKDTRATPNQITLAALCVAAGAAAAFLLWPGHAGLIVAGCVFQLSYVLDCADGQLARVRGTASALGHELDFMTDELKAYVLWSAVAARLWQEAGDVRYLAAGLAGLVLLASNLSLTKFMRHPAFPAPPPKDEGKRITGGGSLGLANWAGKWLIQYPRYLLIVCLVGRIEIFFFAYLAAQALLVLRSLARVVLAVGRGR